LSAYSSSNCSGNLLEYSAMLNACTLTYSGSYQSTSCSGSTYTIKTCTDSACSNCTSTTNSTSCSAYPSINGLYINAYCSSSLPTVNSAAVEINTYQNITCTGTLYQIVAVASDYCFTSSYGNISFSFMYSCNSSSVHIVSCQSSSCSVNCTSFDLPTGCLSGSVSSFSCIAASSHSHNIIQNSSSRLFYGNTIPILYCLLFLVFFVKSKN